MIRVDTQLHGMVQRLILSAPKANVLDAAMIEAIRDALKAVPKRTRLIVFEGEGKHFSFGASVAEHQREQAPTMLHSFHAMFRELLALGVPTCAVVRGLCLGGGLELASWCTHVVATPDARLGQPEIDLAVFPPMASLLLPWRTNGATALQLCTGGRKISAAEARHLGVVDVVTEDPTGWWTRYVNKRLAPKSAVALRHAERAARVHLAWQLEHLLPTLERQYVDELMATADANEGIAAFLEQRSPEFAHE